MKNKFKKISKIAGSIALGIVLLLSVFLLSGVFVNSHDDTVTSEAASSGYFLTSSTTYYSYSGSTFTAKGTYSAGTRIYPTGTVVSGKMKLSSGYYINVGTWTTKYAYTISYNANGGSGAPSSQQTPYGGGNVTLSSTTPMRSYYTFKGWAPSQTAANGGTVTHSPGTTYKFSADTTLYAVWTPTTYTITFNGNGGTAATGSISGEYGSTFTFPGAGRTGYKCLGWSTSSSATQPDSGCGVGSTGTIKGGVTYYAVWQKIDTYTISYNANGGSGAPSAQTKTQGTDLTLSSTKPTKSGCTFLGWATSSPSRVKDVSYQPGGNFTLNKDTTLYAVWMEECEYTVYWHDGFNDHKWGYDVNATETCSPSIISAGVFDYGSSVVPGFVARDDCYGGTAKGWSATFGASTPTWYSSSSIKITTDFFSTLKTSDVVYVYGVWSGSGDSGDTTTTTTTTTTTSTTTTTTTQPSSTTGYTITYKNGLTGDVVATQNKPAGETVTILAPADYSFSAWSPNADPASAKPSYNASSTYSTDADLVLYGYNFVGVVYFANYPDQSAPTPTLYSDTVAIGSNYTVISTIPSYDGYVFKGWTKVASVTNNQNITADHFAGDTITGVTGALYFLADWDTEGETPTYTVTYDANGGSNAPASQTKTHGVDLTLTTDLPTYPADALTFSTWNTAPDGSGTSYSRGGTYTIDADVTLYARYVYPLTYYNNYPVSDGSTFKSTGHTPNTTVTVSTGPTYSGYVFTGWNTAADGSGTAYAAGNTFAMPHSAVKLYAQWEKGTYTVTYMVASTVVGTQVKTHGEDLLLDFPAVSGVAYYTLNSDGSGTQYAVDSETYYTTDANVTYYGVIPTYTITYDTDGGTGAPAAQSKTHDTSVTISSTVPTKEGHTFGGWYTGKNGTGTKYAAGATYSTNANLTLYAKWTPVTYTVTYVAEGATGTPAAQTKTYGVDLELSDDVPAKTGYTFSHWNTSSAGTGTKYNPGDTYTTNSDITLYGIFSPISYKLNYDANGGENAPASQSGDYGSSLTISSTIPARDGYTFKGWGTTSTATTATYNSGDTFTVPAKDTTIYAVWQINEYDLIYDANGGKNAPVTQSGNYGAQLTISSTVPTRDGYTFLGWNKSSTATAADATLAGGKTFTIPAQDTTLYAVWKLNEYTITYKENGGLASSLPANQTKIHGTNLTLHTTTPTRTGYSFTGWNTAADGKGTAYAAGAKYTANANLTLYAQWKANTYPVTYYGNADGVSNVPAAQEKTYGVKLTLSSGQPTRTGYTFEGWNTQADGKGTDYASGAEYTGNAALNLYAKWSINSYDIIYYVDNVKYETETYNYGAKVTALAGPTKTGYTFSGWSAIPDTMPANDVEIKGTFTPNEYTITFDTKGGTPIDSITQNFGTDIPDVDDPTKTGYNFAGWDVQIPDTMPAKDMTITAEWTPVEYKITYVLNGGTNAASNPATYTIEDAVTYANPTKTGSTFKGWFLDSTFKTATTGIIKGSTGDVTVYAKWSLNTYTVTYDANEGKNAPAAQTKSYGIDLTLSSDNPTREGYTFTGWNTKADGSGDDYAAASKYTDNADLKLYAKWSINDYTVTYYVDGVKYKVETYTYGAKVSTLAAPVKTGYTFSGWDTELPETMPANNIEVKGTFAINSYTITYISDGKTYKTAEYNYNADIADVSAPTKTGYTFTGWSPEVPEKMPANDVTVIAQWSANNYIVKFDGNGSTDGSMTDQSFTYNVKQALSENKYTRTGYTFLGWSVDKNATAKTYSDKQEVINLTDKANGTVTLYAVWQVNKYELVYDANGGTGAPAKQSGNYGTELTISSTVPVREGYTFLGWNKTSTATTADAALAGGKTFVIPAENTTLYAIWKINQYSLSYDANGGNTSSVPAKQTGNYKDTIQVSTTKPTREGYTFKGWAESAASTTVKYNGGEDYVIPASNKTVYAVWEINQYDLAYNANGGENTPATQTGNYQAKIKVSTSVPTREGYTFLGWDTSSAGKTVVYKSGSEFTIPAKDTIIYAVWQINEYDLIYDANGGTSAPATQTGNYNSELTISSTTPVRTGYTFLGWGTTANATEVSHKGGDKFTVPASDTTLYAIWKINQYDLVYNANGGEDAPETQSGDYNSIIEMSTSKPTRVGYAFKGWGVSPTATTVAYKPGADFTVPAKDTTVYAIWTIRNYSLTYDANGGTGAPETQSGNYDTALLISETVPTREGYTFLGWGKTADATEVAYKANDDFIIPASNTIIYAIWKANLYTLSYNANGGENAPVNQSGTCGSTLEISSTVPTREGHTFLGWNADKNADKATYVGGNDFIVPAKNTVLYAVWSANEYTITFDENGGSEVPDLTLDYGTDVPDVTPPTKDGYTFDGWTPALPDTMPAEDITVVAQWTANNYIVKFDGNGSTSGEMANQEFEYDVAQNLSANKYAKTGHTFLGWSTSKTATTTEFTDKQEVVNLTKADGGVVTLYAVWKVNPYTLAYNANGGENAPATQTGNYGSELTVSSGKPTREGYTFKGWGTTSAATDVAYNGGDKFTVPAKNTILYAVWEINEYNIVYYVDNVMHKTETYKYNDKVTALSEPTKTGYTFSGWDIEVPTNMPAKNIEVRGVFTINSYTITFDENGGTEVPDLTLDYGEDVPDVTNPTKEGYTFDGWKPVLPDTMPAEDITVVAQWKANPYTLTYDANGGKDAPAAQTANYATEITVSSDMPTREGYTFLGWNEDKTATTADSAYNGGAKYVVPAHNTTVYAVWKMNSYKLTYVVDEKEYKTETVEFGTKITPEANPIKEGYTFSGWDNVPETMPAKDVVVSGTFTINTYKLTYVVGVPILNEDGKYTYLTHYTTTHKYGEDVTALASATKDGFTFLGWDEIPKTMPASDVTVTGLFKRNTYTVSYDTVGGTVIPDADVLFEDNIPDVTDPTKDGYTFDGWDKVIPDTMPDENIDVTAQWIANQYEVRYNANAANATGSMENSKHVYDVAKKLNGNKYSRVGYTFEGWGTASNSTTATYSDGQSVINLSKIDGDVVDIYAIWNAIEYDIVYNLNGGTNNEKNPDKYTVEDTVAFEPPTKENYDFVGWFTDEEFKNPIDTIEKGSTGTVVVYAKFVPTVYNITYVLNGGTNATTNPSTYTVEDEVTFANAVRKGYTFNGWYAEADFKTLDKGIEIGSSGDVTVYAKWTAIPYDINYNLDGGINNPSNPDTYTVEDEVVFEKPTKNGYGFDGWFTDEDLKTPITGIEEGSIGTVDVYAKWTPVVYNITYVLNGGTNAATNPATYTIEDEITFADATRKGYVFNGWYAEAEFKTLDEGIELGSTGDVTVYAKWTVVPYDINYNLDGGINDPNNPDSYTVEDEVTFEAPTKNGYDFDGWYADEDFKTPITGIEEGSVGEVDIYAKWTPVIYNITYVLNDGVNSPLNPATYTIEDEVTFKDASKTGYAFDGWFKNEQFSAETTGIPVGSTGDVTVYAKYTTIPYNINYHLDGGINAPSNPDTYTIETEVTYAAPTKDGYTFDGWYADKDFKDETTGIPVGSIGDVDVYAKWNVIEYPISYELYGGANDPKNPHSYTIESDTIVFADPTKAGHTFLGWLDSNGDEITEIPAGSTGEVKLYADWGINDYDITYVLNGGINHVDNVPFYTYGDAITLHPASREGYEFIGWHEAKDLSDKVITGYPKNTLGDKTVYAEWKVIDYTITYNTNGGVNSPKNPATYTVEDEFEFADATYEYYNFEGWYYDDVTFTQPALGITLGSTGDVTVHAKWTPVEFDVTYELEGGINSDENPDKMTHFDTVDLEDPTREHYDFTGWIDENGDPVTTLTELTGPVTVTATWKATVYTITYEYKGGNVQEKNPLTYTVEDDFELVSTTKHEYIFVEWQDEEGNPVDRLAGEYARDITLTAVYRYDDGLGNIRYVGDMNDTASTNALIVFIGFAVLAAGMLVFHARRKDDEQNEDNIA